MLTLQPTLTRTCTAGYSTTHGESEGASVDPMRVDAPAAMVDGGAGRVWLNGAHAGGGVVTDSDGQNRLWIEADAPSRFERVANSDTLCILLDGAEAYDRTRDVAWLDFFADPDNTVEGLNAAEVADLAAGPKLFHFAATPAPADFA